MRDFTVRLVLILLVACATSCCRLSSNSRFSRHAGVPGNTIASTSHSSHRRALISDIFSCEVVTRIEYILATQLRDLQDVPDVNFNFYVRQYRPVLEGRDDGLTAYIAIQVTLFRQDLPIVTESNIWRESPVFGGRDDEPSNSIVNLFFDPLGYHYLGCIVGALPSNYKIPVPDSPPIMPEQ